MSGFKKAALNRAATLLICLALILCLAQGSGMAVNAAATQVYFSFPLSIDSFTDNYIIGAGTSSRFKCDILSSVNDSVSADQVSYQVVSDNAQYIMIDDVHDTFTISADTPQDTVIAVKASFAEGYDAEFINSDTQKLIVDRGEEAEGYAVQLRSDASGMWKNIPTAGGDVYILDGHGVATLRLVCAQLNISKLMFNETGGSYTFNTAGCSITDAQGNAFNSYTVKSYDAQPELIEMNFGSATGVYDVTFNFVDDGQQSASFRVHVVNKWSGIGGSYATRGGSTPVTIMLEGHDALLRGGDNTVATDLPCDAGSVVDMTASSIIHPTYSYMSDGGEDYYLFIAAFGSDDAYAENAVVASLDDYADTSAITASSSDTRIATVEYCPERNSADSAVLAYKVHFNRVQGDVRIQFDFKTLASVDNAQSIKLYVDYSLVELDESYTFIDAGMSAAEMQGAVDRAPAKDDANGVRSTLVFLPGVYKQDLTIDKPLTLSTVDACGGDSFNAALLAAGYTQAVGEGEVWLAGNPDTTEPALKIARATTDGGGVDLYAINIDTTATEIDPISKTLTCGSSPSNKPGISIDNGMLTLYSKMVSGTDDVLYIPSKIQHNSIGIEILSSGLQLASVSTPFDNGVDINNNAVGILCGGEAPVSSLPNAPMIQLKNSSICNNGVGVKIESAKSLSSPDNLRIRRCMIDGNTVDFQLDCGLHTQATTSYKRRAISLRQNYFGDNGVAVIQGSFLDLYPLSYSPYYTDDAFTTLSAQLTTVNKNDSNTYEFALEKDESALKMSADVFSELKNSSETGAALEFVIDDAGSEVATWHFDKADIVESASTVALNVSDTLTAPAADPASGETLLQSVHFDHNGELPGLARVLIPNDVSEPTDEMNALKVYEVDEAAGALTPADSIETLEADYNEAAGRYILSVDHCSEYVVVGLRADIGDMNIDNKIDIKDAVRLAQLTSPQGNPIENQITRGDIDGNGSLTPEDVTALLTLLAQPAQT